MAGEEDIDRIPLASVSLQRLGEWHFVDPQVALESIESIRTRLSNTSVGEVFLSTLLAGAARSADPDLALTQFERTLDRHPEPVLFCQELSRANELEPLCRLLGSAPAFAAWISRHSDSVRELLATDADQLLSPQRFELIREEILAASDPHQAIQSLRRHRRRESYRIAAFDLLTEKGLPVVLSATSKLADFVLATTLQILEKKHGKPTGGFAIIALGKLGGQELNFSSDIDLIYVSADSEDPSRMVRLARQLTRLLADSSAEGHLYRTDLRLRPKGRAGELIYPLGAYRQYFDTHADSFDRLAMLKSRFAAGDLEVGSQFEKLVSSFVYRKYLDPAAIDEVRLLKQRSDARLSARQRQENIKLGTGGIREVEFFVQSLQLLYGGRDPDLRSRGTLPALATLFDRGYISSRDYQRLSRGYRFLRRVENLLQLDSDLHVQSLPQQERARLRLSRLLGFQGIEPFESELGRCSNEIHGIFRTLFAPSREGELRDLVLNPGVDEQVAYEILQKAGMENEKGVLTALRSLAEAVAYPVAPSKMRMLLARILPNLLQHAARSQDPVSFLARFDRLCERLGSRAHLYQSLVETPEFAFRLYQVLLLGDPLSQRMMRFPEVVDLLSKPPSEEVPLRPLPDWKDEPGPAELAIRIRDFKEREELKIALRCIQQPSEGWLRRQLTGMAERILGRVLGSLLEQRPELDGCAVTLFGLGKIGGGELTFHSDLDLILVYRSSRPELAPLFDDLVRDLKRILEGQFSGPSTYQLDFRLRPEGRRSSPATPFHSFQEYCGQRIELWERLAYTRARPLFSRGPELDFRQILGPRLPPISRDQLDQVLHLRQRKQSEDSLPGAFHVKLAPGGLFDLQLAVELLLLRNDWTEPDTRRALYRLEQEGKIRPSLASLLQEALDLYQRIETAQRLTSGTSSNVLPNDPHRVNQVAALCGVQGGSELIERCRWLSHEVAAWFYRVFETPAEKDPG